MPTLLECPCWWRERPPSVSEAARVSMLRNKMNEQEKRERNKESRMQRCRCSPEVRNEKTKTVRMLGGAEQNRGQCRAS